ncbi:RNA polymerase sigma factor [Desulfonatronum thiosulfatophilum]|nr:sigma-70 family RNA polymerase sigma factor [Desulfonatronum thiosulfatophilum]
MEIDDQRIVLRVRAGEQQAYAVLVDRYQTPVYNLMLRMVRCADLALDLTQDTFTHAYEKLSGFDQNRPFFPWLYTLGLNIARDHLRGNDKERHVTQSLDQMCENGFDPSGTDDSGEGPYERILERGRLNKALASLPEVTREALILRFREGLSYSEIAESLNIGLSNAKMTVQRGLEKMRNLLPREDF